MPTHKRLNRTHAVSEKKTKKRTLEKPKTTSGSNNLENAKIIKFLGQGIIGKVYLVSVGGKKYAMKVEYIPSKDYSFLQTELAFMKQVGSKHPDQFMQLYNYTFIDSCKETYPELPNWFDNKRIAYFDKIRTSGICVKKLYSLVDKTLAEVPFHSLSKRELYSIVIQTLYITHLMHGHGFVHGDFHHGNIGVINTPKNKTLKILGHDVPTFGYQVLAIDYGGMLNKNTLSKTRPYQQWDVTELNHYNDHYSREQILAFDSMVNDGRYWNYINKNNIPMQDFEQDLNLILKQDEVAYLKKYTKNKIILFKLYRLFYPVKFQQTILGSHFKKYIPFEYYIPVEDIVYSYLNYDNTELLIKYYIEKLKE